MYEQPTLSTMWRIADFGYSAPRQLLLQRCEGQHLLSSNGVKQGDPLSAILFCLYLRDVLTQVSAQAEVEVQGFFDDINVSGEPAEVMKAFDALQRLLPEVCLKFNTAKSQFVYFHEDEAPLPRSIRATLAAHDVQVSTEWVEVVGAVIGRDESAIRAGVAATLGTDNGSAAFFARMQLDELKVQSAMLILRHCGVPKMNYAWRCTPPPCIAQQTDVFDELVLATAKAKLLLHDDETQRQATVERLRAPLRHGGFGLTSALTTSPAAYLGSMAAVACASVFEPYAQPDYPLPRASLVHGWIESSMDAVTDASPECAKLLPAAASAFFQHFSPRSAFSSKPSSLQHALSLQATDSVFEASLQLAQEMKKVDSGMSLTRLRAISAPSAWTWKVVTPTSTELTMSDVEYRLAARFNLALQPIDGLAALPARCPLCNNQRDTPHSDPWHFLSCSKLRHAEITTRHDSVSRALYRCALLMGLPARLEPTGLDPDSDLRPDLLLTLPGRHVLTDVAVVHPLGPGKVRDGKSHGVLSTARHAEAGKRRDYAHIAALRHYQMHPFVMETCGGMGPAANAAYRDHGRGGRRASPHMGQEGHHQGAAALGRHRCAARECIGPSAWLRAGAASTEKCSASQGCEACSCCKEEEGGDGS